MTNMEVIYRNLSDIKPLDNNPRKISKEQLATLKKSISENPEYFEARPIILSDRTGELVIIAGNQRYRACKELKFKEVPTILLSGLTEAKEREIIIRDNVNNGEWDDELLADWNADELKEWGVEIHEMLEDDACGGQMKETERLSELKFDTPYYQPEEIPNIKLSECVDLEKFKAKIKVIEESPLTNEQKETLKLFAYRFIRIDFENVANYYAFNASEEEQKLMQRLRLVLVDGGVNGFIEDELIRINNLDFTTLSNEE